MPSLRRVAIPGLDSLGPERRASTVAVSPSGRLAFTGAFDPGDRLITVVDTTGAVLARFGRKGKGPGEFAIPFFLAFDDSLVLAFDAGLLRVVAFDQRGRHRFTRVVPHAGRALDLRADSVFVASGDGRHEVAIERVATATMEGRPFLAAGDSSSLLAITHWAGRPASRTPFAFAANDAVAVVAQPFSYRLQAYTLDGRPAYRFGRDLPPRRRTPRELARARAALEKVVRRGIPGPKGERVVPAGAREALARLATDTLRHFPVIGALHFDGRGRLWVIGDIGDSSFADVFAGPRFLGRIPIGCADAQGAVSLNGRWLAMLCTVTDEDDPREVALQLYRIEEGAGDGAPGSATVATRQ